MARPLEGRWRAHAAGKAHSVMERALAIQDPPDQREILERGFS